MMLLMLCMMGKHFSRLYLETLHLFFSENSLWHFLQIVAATIFMKCQSLFAGKYKKKIHQFVVCQNSLDNGNG